MPATAADSAVPTAEPAPRITVTGNGEASAAAARASLVIGIQTEGATAAAAGTAGAQLTQAVLAALRAANLPATDLKSTHLLVNPEWGYDEHSHQQRRTGFQANTTLVIDTSALERLGAWVDAALGAGATTVSDPSFAPADENGLRHLALTRAIQNARGDAEAMAAAAGGTAGSLLQLASGPEAARPGPIMRAMSLSSAVPAVPTAIIPGDIHLSATVTGIWRYIPGPAAPAR
jgi:uncharacterized protein YggE